VFGIYLYPLLCASIHVVTLSELPYTGCEDTWCRYWLFFFFLLPSLLCDER